MRQNSKFFGCWFLATRGQSCTWSI